MKRLPFLPLLIVAIGPVHAQTTGAGDAASDTGPVSTLIAAHRLHTEALRTANTAALVEAIRLARPIVERPAPAGWLRETTGTALADQPDGAPSPADPAGPETIAIALAFAGEDPALQDLVYDMDLTRPAGQTATVSTATAVLPAGQTDTWRIPYFGMSQAELGIIGDGDSELTFVVTDAEGAVICSPPAATMPDPCRFTPTRNGFFTAMVSNTGSVTNTYLLAVN